MGLFFIFVIIMLLVCFYMFCADILNYNQKRFLGLKLFLVCVFGRMFKRKHNKELDEFLIFIIENYDYSNFYFDNDYIRILTSNANKRMIYNNENYGMVLLSPYGFTPLKYLKDGEGFIFNDIDYHPFKYICSYSVGRKFIKWIKKSQNERKLNLFNKTKIF